MRVRVWTIVCLATAGGLGLVWLLNGRSEVQQESNGGAVRQMLPTSTVSEFDHPGARSPGSLVRTPEDRIAEVYEKLRRVSRKVNEALGTDIRVMLGQTGAGGRATGRGIVYVDISLLGKISEDALAVVIAHEFAHEVLGHVRELEFLGPQNRGLPSRPQQLRALEQEADALAGSTLALTSYRPEGFAELLDNCRDTEWADPLIRTYYPNQDRLRTFLEGYEGKRAALRAEKRRTDELGS